MKVKVLLLAFLLPLWAGHPCAETSPLSILITASAGNAKISEPIIISIAVTNTSQTVLNIPVPLVQYFYVDVVNGSGTAPPATGEARIENPLALWKTHEEVSINPGEQYSETFTLNSLYNIGVPGTYLVRVGLHGVHNDGSSVNVLSNLIRVLVTN
jgi:hypothetical protein